MSLADATCKVQDFFSCPNQKCSYNFGPRAGTTTTIEKTPNMPSNAMLVFMCLPKWHKTQCQIKEEPFRYFFLFSEVCCFPVCESDVLSAGVKTTCMFVRYIVCFICFSLLLHCLCFFTPEMEGQTARKNCNFQNTTALDTSTRKGGHFETLNASVW